MLFYFCCHTIYKLLHSRRYFLLFGLMNSLEAVYEKKSVNWVIPILIRTQNSHRIHSVGSWTLWSYLKWVGWLKDVRHNSIKELWALSGKALDVIRNWPFLCVLCTNDTSCLLRNVIVPLSWKKDRASSFLMDTETSTHLLAHVHVCMCVYQWNSLRY